MRAPTGAIVKTVEKGTEPKSQTAIVFTGPFEYNQTQRVVIRAMAQVLEARLVEAIREELGGTYSIDARAEHSRVPRQEYSISIQFGSDPARVDALVARVFQEIERLKVTGPAAGHIGEVKLALLRDFEINSKSNSYVLDQMAFRYQHGEDVEALWDVPKYYEKLDALTIREAARKYLDLANYVRVTLLPVKK